MISLHLKKKNEISLNENSLDVMGGLIFKNES